MLGVLAVVLGVGVAWTPPSGPPDRPPQQQLRDALELAPGASCLEVDRLVEVIRGALRTSAVDARLTVAVVGDAQDEFAVEYTVRREGTVIAVRRFEADATNCEQLHAVVGVSVALAIDATVLLPEPEAAEPEPEADPRPQRLRPTDPERPPELAADPQRGPLLEASPWMGAVLVRGGAGIHAPPLWSGVGAVAVELRWKERLAIDAGLIGAQGGFVEVGDGRAAFTLVGLNLDLCGGVRFERLYPRACAGFVGGGALARGRGFASTRSDRLPWVGVTFGGDLRVRVAKRVELEFGADGLVHLLQPGFDFVDETGARQAGREFPWVGGWLTAGVVVSFR